MKISRLILLPVIAFILLVSVADAQLKEGPDTVWVNGRTTPEKGWIVSENYKELKLKITEKGSVTKKLKQENIRKIKYGDEPTELTSAKREHKKGRYESALKYLAKIPATTPRVKMYVDFYTADSLYKSGKTEEGKALLLKIAQNANSKFFVRARETLADICIREQKFDQAIEHYEELAANARLDDAWKRRAQFNASKCLFAKKDKDSINQAARKLRDLSIHVRDDELKKDISLFEVKIMLEQENYGAAKSKLNQLSKKLSGPIITNGFGDIAFKEKNYAEARYNYLKTVALPCKDKNDYLKGLYMAALCFEKLMDTDKTGAERARQLYNMVVEKGAGTEWEAKAKENLNNLE